MKRQTIGHVLLALAAGAMFAVTISACSGSTSKTESGTMDTSKASSSTPPAAMTKTDTTKKDTTHHAP